jgi:hypothetical protein
MLAKITSLALVGTLVPFFRVSERPMAMACCVFSRFARPAGFQGSGLALFHGALDTLLGGFTIFRHVSSLSEIDYPRLLALASKAVP